MRRARRKAKRFTAESAESAELKTGFKTGKTGFKTGMHVFKAERQALRSGTNPITTPAFFFVLFVSLW
jgi:hypothetical protein